jgi:hypothetical protein
MDAPEPAHLVPHEGVGWSGRDKDDLKLVVLNEEKK